MIVCAAIDVGSNATRLSMVALSRWGTFKKSDFHRYPIRLGTDAFTQNAISDRLLAELDAAFAEIKQHLAAWKVSRLRAVATSAMRDARNAARVCEVLRKNHDIELEVISGDEESRLSHAALERTLGSVPQDAVFIDLGGGSLEVERKNKPGQSLQMGSVRLLEQFPKLRQPVAAHTFSDIREQIIARLQQELVDTVPTSLAIGTGGNLDILAQLLAVPGAVMPSIDVQQMEPLAFAIAGMSLDERMHCYKIRRDRADLILPAMIIVSALAHVLRLQRIVVPGAGLREALLYELSTPSQQALGLDISGRARTCVYLFGCLFRVHRLWPPALAALTAAAQLQDGLKPEHDVATLRLAREMLDPSKLKRQRISQLGAAIIALSDMPDVDIDLSQGDVCVHTSKPIPAATLAQLRHVLKCNVRTT